ncbi:MAG: hypothetical protein M0Z61_04805 [Nitrospiraceae bacterium]|nr:hypothetical protein [Nitrospiraceae bacterium]
MATAIPDELFTFFAQNPEPLNLAREAADITSPIYNQLNDFLSAIPNVEVATSSKEPTFQAFKVGTDIERAARIWIAQQRLSGEIARRRLEALRVDAKAARPKPYEISVLSDIEVDTDHLVALSDFEFDGSRLLHNGYAFLVLTTTSASNSTYWLLKAIYAEGLAEQTRVRLDPFLFGPQESFPDMFYKMWVYGRPLNWQRIAKLKEAEYGRWQTLNGRSEFTDFVWNPRERQVHFVCEEVPRITEVEQEPSRYFHTVYMPSSENIDHFDGAIRLYTPDEILERRRTHIRYTGKMGLREKVFLTKGAVSRESFSTLARTFFIWNEDVQTYFEHERKS